MPGVYQVPQKQGAGIGEIAGAARNIYGAYKDFSSPDPAQQAPGQQPAPPPVDLGASAGSGAIDRRIKMSAAPGRNGGY